MNIILINTKVDEIIATSYRLYEKMNISEYKQNDYNNIKKPCIYANKCYQFGKLWNGFFDLESVTSLFSSTVIFFLQHQKIFSKSRLAELVK